jgi:hypothetical protein
MIDPEFEEMDREFEAIRRLTEINRVKNLLREQREDKSPKCNPACSYDRTPETLREHDTPRPMMIASSGNKHYKPGTRHMMCESCYKRKKREVDIGLSLPSLMKSRK